MGEFAIEDIATDSPDFNRFGQKRYRGWAFGWTGWKPDIYSPVIAGQWVGYRISERESPDGPRYIFSSMPGAAGLFKKGDSFSLAALDSQEHHFRRTNNAIANGVKPDRWEDYFQPSKEHALDALIALIDKLEGAAQTS